MPSKAVDEDKLSICQACGTQYDELASEPLENCRICDDPRQFVPIGGQKWTSLAEIKKTHRNQWTQDQEDERLWSVVTVPKFGIGQRAWLIQTPEGNVMWDLVALIDEETISFIKSKGGLKAIVISHPHFYTTHLQWASIFKCLVYSSVDDEGWLNRHDRDDCRRPINDEHEEIASRMTMVTCRGHFDGSLVLHWDGKLFVGDTIMPVQSGLYHVDRPVGTTSFTFMWSYPNMIPLHPDKIHGIWRALKPFDFNAVYAAFEGLTIRDDKVKARILESMKIQVSAMGHTDHPLLKEEMWAAAHQ